MKLYPYWLAYDVNHPHVHRCNQTHKSTYLFVYTNGSGSIGHREFGALNHNPAPIGPTPMTQTTAPAAGRILKQDGQNFVDEAPVWMKRPTAKNDPMDSTASWYFMMVDDGGYWITRLIMANHGLWSLMMNNHGLRWFLTLNEWQDRCCYLSCFQIIYNDLIHAMKGKGHVTSRCIFTILMPIQLLLQ